MFQFSRYIYCILFIFFTTCHLLVCCTGSVRILFLNVHYSQFNTSLHAMVISKPILDPHLEDVYARATLLCSVHDDDLMPTVALRLFYIYLQRKPTLILTLYL